MSNNGDGVGREIIVFLPHDDPLWAQKAFMGSSPHFSVEISEISTEPKKTLH
jgi:hypothetical protein